jgi:8-hydroxy-5-deazaflavin:NADPH oxidoreductase
VTLSASNPEHARDAATQSGGQAADSNQAAVASVEVVMLAVPYPAVDAVLAEVGDALAGKVLIDATNRSTRPTLAASWTPARPPSRSRRASRRPGW